MTRSLVVAIAAAVCMSSLLPLSGSSQSPLNADVLEITPPVFDAVIRGLTVELKLQEDFRRKLANYLTHEEQAACGARATQSPEGSKIMAQMTTMPDNISATEAQRRMIAASTSMDSLVKKQCPGDPNVWNAGNRKRKLDEIHLQAAEAAGPAPSGASVPSENRRFAAVKFEVNPFSLRDVSFAFLTGRQYSILVERIERGCASLGGPQGIGARTAPAPNIPPIPGMTPGLVSGGGSTSGSKSSPPAKPADGAQAGVAVPGVGNNILWVYTPSEMGVLTPENCRRFAELNKRLMK